MKISRTGLLKLIAAILLAGLGVACQNRSSSEPAPFSISTATPSASGGVPVRAQATPEPTVEYVISSVPPCPHIEKLAAPLDFAWPNKEEALEKLADYNWGYYRCPMTQAELLSFYRTNMPKPPYLWREVNHADHLGGIVVLFYQAYAVTWMYIWMLPDPANNTSYLVIARGDPGTPQTWECMRSVPVQMMLEGG